MMTQVSELLSSVQQERLRKSVDVRALERFLAAAPEGFRRFYFLACVESLTEQEVQALGPLAAFPPRRRHLNAGRLLDPRSSLEALWEAVEVFGDGDA
jgi:hypothetical protein